MSHPFKYLILLVLSAGCQRESDKVPAQDTTSSSARGGNDETPAQGTTSGAPGVCRAGNLQLTLAGSDAGAGQRGMTFSIRNSGHQPCLIGGYPALRLIDSSGRQLDSIVPRNETGFPDSTFSLEPDSLASFQITFTGIPAGITCYQATRLEVIPTGMTDTLGLTTPIAPCGDRINVRPIVPGLPPL